MMRRIFTKLDLDNNGILDRKEMELALTYLGESFTKADMDNLMVIIDKVIFYKTYARPLIVLQLLNVFMKFRWILLLELYNLLTT